MVYYRFGYGNDNVSNIFTSEKEIDLILSWILIDNYIKIYTKKNETIQYVENAKKSLSTIINNENTLKDFKFFLHQKKELNFKNSYKFLKKCFSSKKIFNK